MCIHMCLRLTIATVELDSVGGQLNRDTTLAGLRKFEVLHLAVSAEYINIQDLDLTSQVRPNEEGRNRDME